MQNKNMISIPRIFHRIWLGDAPMPEEFAAWGQEWLDLHPGWTMRQWGNEDAARFEMKNRALFDASKTGAGKADILRLEILEREGGVYLDTDFKPLKNIEPLLWGARAVVGWHNALFINNAIIGAIPGHSYIRALIEAVPEGIASFPTLDLQSGPGLLTRVKNSGEFPGLRDFGPGIFYPYDWNEDGCAVEDFPNAFAVHHWAKSWVNPNQVTILPLVKSSVIIPCSGDLERLNLTLQGFAAQSEKDFEIIVVGDGTEFTEPLSALCQTFGARCIPVPLYPGEQRPRTSKVRNLGAQLANGELLLFCDQDCIPDPDWIGKHTSVSEPKVVSYNLRRLFSENSFNKFKGNSLSVTNWKHLVFDSMMEDRRVFNAGDPVHEFRSHGFCVNRQDFLRIGGFSTEYDGTWGSEDTNLASRMRRDGWTFHRMDWGAFQTHLGHPFLDCSPDGRTHFLRMLAVDPHCPIVANGGPLDDLPDKADSSPSEATSVESGPDIFDGMMVPLKGTLPENSLSAAKKFAVATLSSEDDMTISLLDDFLGSMLANGGLGDEHRIVVFAGSQDGNVPRNRAVVEAHRTAGAGVKIDLIPVVSTDRMCVKSKAMLYSISSWLEDDAFLVMDCDILVLKPIEDLIKAIEITNGILLAGNSIQYRSSSRDIFTMYNPANHQKINDLWDSIEENSPFNNSSVGHGNVGIVGGRKELFSRLLDGIESWKHHWKPFVDSEPPQSAIDELLVLVTLDSLNMRVELSELFNYSLWNQGMRDSIVVDGTEKEMKVSKNGKGIVFLHFAGNSKTEMTHLRGAFCAKRNLSVPEPDLLTTYSSFPVEVASTPAKCLLCSFEGERELFVSSGLGTTKRVCLLCAGAPCSDEIRFQIEKLRSYNG